MPADPAEWAKNGYLFNMIEDPYETTNVYEQHPDIVEELNQLLFSYSIIEN